MESEAGGFFPLLPLGRYILALRLHCWHGTPPPFFFSSAFLFFIPAIPWHHSSTFLSLLVSPFECLTSLPPLFLFMSPRQALFLAPPPTSPPCRPFQPCLLATLQGGFFSKSQSSVTSFLTVLVFFTHYVVPRLIRADRHLVLILCSLHDIYAELFFF